MKSILKRYRIVLATLLVVAAHSAVNAATPVSPVFTNGATGWDCLISGKGSQQGVLFLTFSGDGLSGSGTFTGALISSRVAYPKASTDRSGIPTGRNPSDPETIVTNNVGYVEIAGLWAYDANGYTVGSFAHLVQMEAASTNSITNSVSFRAKISPNKRLTASYSSSIEGNGTYRGVPIKTVTDLSGTWTGEEKNGSLTTYEWFSLSPTPTIWPNIYTVAGYGPSYALNGYCMVSSQKKIAFGNFKDFDPTNSIVRGTVGPFVNKSTALGGKTKGQMNFGTNIVTYNSFRVSAPIP